MTPSLSAVKVRKFLRVELHVGEHLRRGGWDCLFHNVQMLGVQIDWITRDPQGTLTLIEVKTQSRSCMARLSIGQRARLFRVASFLAQWEPVALRLALVAGQNVQLVPVDALTG